MNPDGTINVSNWQMIGEAIAVFWPILIAVVIKPRWAEGTKALVALIMAAALAAGAIWLDGRVNWQNVQATVLTIVLTTAVFYARFWRPTGVTDAVEHNVLP